MGSSRCRSIALATFALLSGAALAGGNAAPAPKAAVAPPAPPPYTAVRWSEDYLYLSKAPKTDFFDGIKYVPLGSDPDWHVSFGAQARLRYEYFNNFNFAPPTAAQDEDGYYLTRLFAHADLHLGKSARVFVQGKSSMIDDRVGGPRPIDADEADIQQLFFDYKFDLGGKNSATVRLGRQDLIYGAQRLISPLDWTNTRRTFEGAKIATTFDAGSVGQHALDLFWVRPVDVDKEELNDGDGQTSFAGAYDTISLPGVMPGSNTKLELYALALNRTNARFGANAAATAGTRDEDRYTLGFRLSGAPKPWDYDVEAAYQFGKIGDQTICAWSVAAEVGYTVAGNPMAPRFFVGFDAASGDDAGGNFGTFNQLFPLGHAYFGFIDVIGRQNIVDLHPGVELTLIQNAKYAKKLSFRADYHMFWRQEQDDAVYNVGAGAASSPPNAGVLRGASGSGEMFIGSEIDLLVTWQVDRHLQIIGGYSHFFAGDFIENTGASKDIDFAYLAVQFTF